MRSKLNFDSYFYFLAHKLIFMGFLFVYIKTLLYICRIKLEIMNINEFLESEDFKYIEHRGTTDTYVKNNVIIKIPWITVIVDNKTTHMLPPYEVKRLEEIIDDIKL